MGFKFREESLEGYRVLRCTNTDTGAYFEILPELGGTVRQIGLAGAGKAGGGASRALLVPDGPGEINDNPWFRGRFLFPFNDRIPGGRYSFDGRNYSLPVNDPGSGDALHGFLYNRPVEALRTGGTEESGEISWQFRSEPSAGYPFSPLLKVRIRLFSRRITIHTAVENTGDGPLPFSLGWHPYFAPPGSADLVDRIFLRIPAKKYIEVNGKLLPSGRILPVPETPFDFSSGRRIGSEELDLGYFDLSGPVLLASDLVGDNGYGASDALLLSQDADFFSCLQVFIPPDRNSIALEPVTAGTNAFNLPELGLNRLEAGECRQGAFSLEIPEF